MTNTTERLRAILDERGVEWWNETDPEPQSITMARADEQLIEYHENANGSTGYHIFNMHDLTPEQAIAATLGAGTCKVDAEIKWNWDRFEPPTWYLSCGHRCEGVERPRYCSVCGKRVVEVDE